MKTKNTLFWLGIIIITISISYSWSIGWNTIYNNTEKIFFSWNLLNDIKDTLWAAINEEVLWRFIPLLTISHILSSLKYDSSKKRKNTLCIISFVIILLVQAAFGISHYSKIYETQDWIIKHIVLQGTMGMFYASAYNMVQYYIKKIHRIRIITSHLIALASSFIIHSTVNTLLIINFTY